MLAARPPASSALGEAALCAAAWGRLASLPGVDHDENVSIELRQLTRLRTTLEVASATALQPGPAGLLVYANARNSVRAALEGSPPAKEFELLFPRADASFSLSPEYPIVLLGQLIVWLRELEQSLADSVVSPELILVDPRAPTARVAGGRAAAGARARAGALAVDPEGPHAARRRRPAGGPSRLPGDRRRLRAARVDPDGRDRSRVLRPARLHRPPDQHSLTSEAGCGGRRSCGRRERACFDGAGYAAPTAGRPRRCSRRATAPRVICNRDQHDRDDPLGGPVVVVGIPARHLEPVVPEEREDTEDAAEGCEGRLDLVETASVFQHHSPLFGLQETSESRRIGEPL